MHTYYLQAATESAILTALESAGLAQAVPEQTVTQPEHQAPVWEPVENRTLQVELFMEFGFVAKQVEYMGVDYFGTGSGWHTLSFVTVPEQDVTVPAHIAKKEGVHLVMVGTISKRIGGTEEEPVMETLPGYHVNLHLDERYGDISDEQRAMLPIIAAPKNPVSVLA